MEILKRSLETLIDSLSATDKEKLRLRLLVPLILIVKKLCTLKLLLKHQNITEFGEYEVRPKDLLSKMIRAYKRQ